MLRWKTVKKLVFQHISHPVKKTKLKYDGTRLYNLNQLSKLLIKQKIKFICNNFSN